MKHKKVILAFSGGLDTSYCAVWLKEQGYAVVTVTVDTGGFTSEEMQKIALRSKELGVASHYFIDGKTDLYEKLITYIIKGNILRGGVYPLIVGPERIIITEKISEVAKKEGASAVAHGSTGAGNDQVRFDLAFQILASQLKIFDPIREYGLKRADEVKYLEQHGIDVPLVSKSYSLNQTLTGVTVGGKETTGSWEAPKEEVYPGITPLAETPDQAQEIIITFQKGLPSAIDGKRATGVKIIDYLNSIGAKHGVGKNIHLGNTILGIKGRVAFAAPALTILIKAHKELEKLVFTKWQAYWKDMVADFYGNLLHEGLYFDPVMKDFETFINSSQSRVSGKVKVKLYKGNIVIEGYQSPYSLMSSQVAIYGEANYLWTGEEAKGFIKLYGLQSLLAFQAQKKGEAYEKANSKIP